MAEYIIGNVMGPQGPKGDKGDTGAVPAEEFISQIKKEIADKTAF